MGLLPANEGRWALVSQDFPGHEILGDFPPVDLIENVSATWVEQSTLGLSQPILQFVGGTADTFSFQARVWAKHQGILGTGLLRDDVDEKVAEIKAAARAHPDLGRPEVFLFAIASVGLARSIGTLLGIKAPEPQIAVQVVVRSVGGIRYDRFRGDGSMRGAIFSMDLVRYEPYDAEALVTTQEAESLVTPARTGESYEHIAARVHGDPTLGEALRRRNPERPVLAVEDLVHVPSARILRREITPLTPQSLALRSGDEQRENKLAAFKARGGPVSTHVLLKNWGS